MLRESANLVEKGEFDSILYEALQDFRVYYKQKYPKTKRKKKSHITKENEKGSNVQTKSDTATTASESKNTDMAGSTILKDLKESEDTTTTTDKQKEEDVKVEQEFSSEKTTGNSSEEITANNETDINDSDVDSNVKEIYDICTNGTKSDTTTPAMKEGATATTTSTKPENSTKINDIPVAVPIFTADVSVASPSPNPRVTNTTTVPVEMVAPIPPPPKPINKVASAPSTIPDRIKEASPTPSTNNRAAIFGKLKVVGATLNTVKKAALNVTGKNHHHHHSQEKNYSTAREDLEIFGESGINKAESSGRRTSAEQLNGGSSSNNFGNNANNNNNDVDHKTRTFVGMTGAASAAISSQQYQQNNAHVEPRVNDNNYYQSNEFKSNSFGNNSNNINNDHGDERNPDQTPTNQRQEPTVYESKRFVNKQENHIHIGRTLSITKLNNLAEEPSKSNDTYDTVTSSEKIRSSADHSRAAVTPSERMEGGKGAKPSFQRPAKEGSSLVVNGWIEQFRRSKFRHTWKEVLASLVEGQKPGEVTTLWIQRETRNSSTGQTELEALHRIPLKVLEDVSFQDNTTDNQFRLKLYNSSDDFVFRCNGAANDALRWVQILKKHENLAKGINNEEEKKGSETSSNNNFSQQQQQQTSSTKGMGIRDLRAICHGAGINTAGMERRELETAAKEVQSRGTYFEQRGTTTAAAEPPDNARYNPNSQHLQQQEQYSNSQPQNTSPEPPQQEQQQQQRVGIKELRAICHGAGINTAGMERRELEAAAKEVQSRGTYFDPPPGMHAPSEEEIRARQEKYRRQQQQNEEFKKRQEQEVAAEAERRRREIDEARRRAVEEESRRRIVEEESRRRAAEEEARRKATEEEARRRASAEEQQRRQQEAQAAQARYAQQQAAWQKKQQEEQQRQLAAEQKAAEERRRRDEALRKQQEWAAPASGAHPQQQQYQQPQQPQQQAYSQQQQWHQQQQPSQNRAPPPPPPPQQKQQREHSGADDKYAKMANQSTDDGQAAITKIKHGILIQWALQPPQLQMLRPIAALVTTIHNIFPPALGVSGHDYFKKWKPIFRNDITGAAGLPDEDKLKKSVRKIRFFLHPDKLPRDLNEEQKFMVKMLWDITSDAWEEYQKHKEDLDWVK